MLSSWKANIYFNVIEKWQGSTFLLPEWQFENEDPYSCDVLTWMKYSEEISFFKISSSQLNPYLKNHNKMVNEAFTCKIYKEHCTWEEINWLDESGNIPIAMLPY